MKYNVSNSALASKDLLHILRLILHARKKSTVRPSPIIYVCVIQYIYRYIYTPACYSYICLVCIYYLFFLIIDNKITPKFKEHYAENGECYITNNLVACCYLILIPGVANAIYIYIYIDSIYIIGYTCVCGAYTESFPIGGRSYVYVLEGCVHPFKLCIRCIMVSQTCVAPYLRHSCWPGSQYPSSHSLIPQMRTVYTFTSLLEGFGDFH